MNFRDGNLEVVKHYTVDDHKRFVLYYGTAWKLLNSVKTEKLIIIDKHETFFHLLQNKFSDGHSLVKLVYINKITVLGCFRDFSELTLLFRILFQSLKK